MQRISDGSETAGRAALCSCCISRLARVRMEAEDCESMESEAKESKDVCHIEDHPGALPPSFFSLPHPLIDLIPFELKTVLCL